MRSLIPARTAIVSPHLDDAVLSLGATIFRGTQAGSYVRVVTVFAGDPDSDRPASGWDSLPGHLTEGEATRTRREEDAQACTIVGADRRYLRFSEPTYAGIPDPADVVAEVNSSLRDLDAVLLPGFPLIHRDHRWLAQHLLEGGLECSLVGLYVEQPYRHQKARFRTLRVDPSLGLRSSARVAWQRTHTRRIEMRTKHRAIAAYTSQRRWLDLEGKKLDRMLQTELLRGGERIAWLEQGGSGPPGG
jgi:LmbE family N-acetylglucosaminyl deacetylase